MGWWESGDKNNCSWTQSTVDYSSSLHPPLSCVFVCLWVNVFICVCVCAYVYCSRNGSLRYGRCEVLISFELSIFGSSKVGNPKIIWLGILTLRSNDNLMTTISHFIKQQSSVTAFLDRATVGRFLKSCSPLCQKAVI